MAEQNARIMTVKEARLVPLDSVIFGWIAMVPFGIGALGAVVLPSASMVLAQLTVLWGAAILMFLAGVRRGVSFRTPGGPTPRQIAVMFSHFVIGGLAMLIVAAGLDVFGVPPVALASGLLLLGFASLAVLDPIGAEAGTMPLHFRRLRPVQMAVPVIAFAALLVMIAA